jgi:anthraniloyl-CoA monooxygenase
MRIVCAGAGPAGLYFAIRAKLGDPGREVTVLERHPAGVTYGWGVGYWDDLLRELHRNDPVSARRIQDVTGVWDGVELHVGDRPPAYLGGYGLSMGRQALLDILAARAVELGVDVRFEHALDPAAGIPGADLVVAADGVNSALREAAGFQPEIETGRNKYLWLGTHAVLHQFRYLFERTDAGWMWLHAYYLDQHRSTCIVECEPRTWEGLGFAEMDADRTLKALGQVFGRHLGGHELISQLREGDQLPWLNFRLLRNRTWARGNVALLGDAAHTTHFSIGSGTKLAVGDAIALAGALDTHPGDVPAALRAYDAARRPVVDAVQDQARASMRWLEGVGERLDGGLDRDPVQLAHLLSTRLGQRTARWRYWMHLGTQVGPLRGVRRQVTALRRRQRLSTVGR